MSISFAQDMGFAFWGIIGLILFCGIMYFGLKANSEEHGNKSGKSGGSNSTDTTNKTE